MKVNIIILLILLSFFCGNAQDSTFINKYQSKGFVLGIGRTILTLNDKSALYTGYFVGKKKVFRSNKSIYFRLGYGYVGKQKFDGVFGGYSVIPGSFQFSKTYEVGIEYQFLSNKFIGLNIGFDFIYSKRTSISFYYIPKFKEVLIQENYGVLFPLDITFFNNRDLSLSIGMDVSIVYNSSQQFYPTLFIPIESDYYIWLNRLLTLLVTYKF